MIEFFKTIFEGFKIAPRYLAAIAMAAAILFFGSDNFLEGLGLREFANDHRAVLGGAVLFAACIAAIFFYMDVVVPFIQERRRVLSIIDRLHRLTEAEKQILRYYIAEQTRSSTLRVRDGIVQGLEAAGIIYRAFSTGSDRYGFPYNIEEFAWNYLNVHADILVGTTSTYRFDGPIAPDVPQDHHF